MIDVLGTIPTFQYSDELIKFMNENGVYEPTEARALVHSIIEDLLDELKAEQLTA
jgi:hypothetical protein